MNREIKFRGKSVDDGEWLIGDIVHRDSNNKSVSNIQIKPFDYGGAYAVDKSTVGQFTGLTDKNGKEIFEGDIITDDENFGLVIFNLGFDIEFYGKSGSFTEGGWNEDAGSYGIIETTELNEQVSEWATVLGNIHDDPELIKTK